MTGFMLFLTPDDDGAVWMEAQSPLAVAAEKSPPHRIALKTTLANAMAQPAEFATWLRIDRLEAYKLLDQLRGVLRDATDGGAEGITTSLDFELVLNGGVENATGKMVILAKAKDGRTYRLLFAPDQSGLLSEMLGRAASAAAQHMDEKMNGAGGAIVKTEIYPREPELVRVAVDPVSGREILSFRLSNDLEYSFLLTEGQSQMLHKAMPPIGAVPPGSRPN